MKLLLILILFTITFPKNIFALTPTPTAKVASPTATVTPTNLDEIQKIRQAVQEKVQEKLKEIINVEKKRGWVGSITLIDNTTITVNSNNTTRTITTDENTAILDLNKKKIDTTKLKEGQTILALGYENADGILATKRILVMDPDYLPVKKIITVGKIVDRSTTSDVAVLIPSNNKNVQYQLTLTSKTVITDLDGKKLLAKEVATSRKIIAILTSNLKTKNYTTNRIYLVDPIPTPTKKLTN